MPCTHRIATLELSSRGAKCVILGDRYSATLIIAHPGICTCSPTYPFESLARAIDCKDFVSVGSLCDLPARL